MLSMEEFLKGVVDDIGDDIAEELAAEMRRVCSVAGSPGTPAKPHAPPRRITGRLMQSIRVRNRMVEVDAPYAGYLQFSTDRRGFPHQFVEPALKNLGLS